ncbi:tyrosine-type recombinase/integrase [Acidovorax sp. NCPPB 4044]|uniref:tyrosine-type recombinase/integrase n=1 Tax=Acidovorax sp. NCPPB 4044 TaxID=2940490 RepID=UPI0023036030|nr:tyrosine-type recombinase/integrase [Acidovorax sp. NCPPB 4044]MDA8522027.1 tyrosine-type recombinase/integrase [Acidovorax sp. NCPPB 4044]
MGRKPTRWTNLPTGMRARARAAKIYYYLDTGGKPRREIPLGSDYVLAVAKWAELTSKQTPTDGVLTVPYVVGRYFAEVVPNKALNSQRSDRQEQAWVLKFFGDPPAPLDGVEPQHIRQFMRWRAAQARAIAVAKQERRKDGAPPKDIPPTHGQVRANRAKALVSHLWNWAREEGITKLPNPCAGVKRFTEKGRDTAPDAAMVRRVLDAADLPLQFAMRLADIIGQRPQDVRTVSEADLRDGVLHVKQGKTKAKLRIEVVGELAALMGEIVAFKRARGALCMALLVDEDGRPLSAGQIRYRFDKARENAGIPKADFQFRDFRAKAATEADDASGTRAAQALLGHTTEAMTADYIRHKAGKKVTPLR